VPVEAQIMMIYAATNGFLDDVPAERVRKFESGFHEFVRTQRPEIGESIRTEKVLSDATAEKLKKALDEYKEGTE
jgi:F-type H+-transporting ATPase subunit alpha